MDRVALRDWRRIALLSTLLVLTLGAGPSSVVRIDTWEAAQVGPLDLTVWRPYPPNEQHQFKRPPEIVMDGGRPVLRLTTAGEPMRVGRAMTVDVAKRRWLAWDWKALELPGGGDVRHPRRNDQAGRVMVVFGGMKGILYVWDTTAPVGVETPPDPLELFQRVLIVVRSGAQGVGEWHSERRDVYADFRRVFEEEPQPVKLIGLESHSNDTGTKSAVLFGSVRFE
jgi:hypothetical protein